MTTTDPAAVTVPMSSLLVNGTKCFATLWAITRTDSVTLRFTDHNTQVVYQGNAYSPIDAIATSADQTKEGLEPQNKEVRGVLSSALITHEDLRQGLYRDALVTEYLVDWRYPWAGYFFKHEFILEETSFTGETWQGTLVSRLRAKLRNKRGATFTRNCRYTLGDSRCGVDIASMGVMATVDTPDVVRPRASFSSDALGYDDDYFSDGTIIWILGANAGQTQEIKSFVSAGGTITLQTNASNDIQSGDTGIITPGCGYSFKGCGKFDNKNQYGGFPYLPGNDKLYATPDILAAQ